MKKSFVNFLVRTTLLALTTVASYANSNSCRQAFFTEKDYQNQIDFYLTDTLNSLNVMRGENGLIKDTIWIRSKNADKGDIEVLNDNTSPTNIAVDLIIQSELALSSANKGQALKNLEKVMGTLDKLAYHKDTGLFYSRYTTKAVTEVKDYAVSSIDNFHLAIALFTAKESFPGTALAAKAKKLFERMDFSVYLDEAKGVIGGNLRHDKDTNTWTKELYNLDDLGSEGRAIYSAGWAMGLFHKIKNDAAFPAKALAALRAEVGPSESGNLLKLWDGSAFQLYFPKMFINEEVYSPQMGKFYRSLADHMIAEGQRRKLNTPASHSASYAGKGDYRDKSGNKSVVSSFNNDVKRPDMRKDWESTMTPNALFMAGSTNTQKFMPIILDLQNINAGQKNPFYLSNMGWMDGYHVKGHNKGQVVPVQLSLNQGMIALSLLQMKDPKGMSLSSRKLFENPATRQRLQYFYSLFDQKIASESVGH